MAKKKIFVLLYFAIIINTTHSYCNDTLKVLFLWEDMAIELTKNSPGFTPPVSARAFAYFNISLFISTNIGSENLKEKLKVFSGIDCASLPEKNIILNKIFLINSCASEMIKLMYATMPKYELGRVNLLRDSLKNLFIKKIDKKIIIASEEYGIAIANAIHEWSKSDGGNECYFNNYPSTFETGKEPCSWQRTPPGFLRAMQPNWGSNKSLLKDIRLSEDTLQYFGYSTDTNSILYKNAKEINQINSTLTKEQENIAEYWDDSPGYSGTPTGHILALSAQLIKNINIPSEKAAEILMMVSVAANEALIICWRFKYKYDLLRPVTYIQRNINKNFNSLLATPPFPEFPSGHSYQTAASMEILKYYLPDYGNFTDSVNINRTDIPGTPRTFNNFDELAEEVTISRMYGGIHYRKTLEISLAEGKKIGNKIVEHIKNSGY